MMEEGHHDMNKEMPVHASPLDKVIRFCLENKLVVAIMVMFVVVWGVMVAPFDWDIPFLERDPVPVDAIPDIGENQQIVFTEWMGRSPQDVDDQVTYPLTVALLGVPGVKTIRSTSSFGFSSIYVIFKDNVDFYWSRSRILEKLSSLRANTLPEGVQPALGPDATGLGQVFWYTLEGMDEQGKPTGGWDLDELRSAQDWFVRYQLLGVDGVAEVASVGGFVREYQINVDPDAMAAHNVRLDEVFMAVRMSNADVGAKTIEVNKVEYLIRGLGFIRTLEDIEDSLIKMSEDVPIYIKDVANVTLGPAQRRGVLDKEGAEAVGGVVVVRYGDNPLRVIKNVKEKIKEISPGLPRKTLPDGTISQVSIVPFYDRSGLIYETLDTLNTAISEEILVTIIVVIVMLMHLKSAALISGLLPLAVLLAFIGMKYARVDANIVALSGIAIAIGTIVDMGVVICENILRHLDEDRSLEKGASAKRSFKHSLEVIYRATSEVGGAVLTAVATTVVSFLPVFSMQAAEGKLFKPLAYTKTFALIASVVVALTMIPPFAHLLFTARPPRARTRKIMLGFLALAGVLVWIHIVWWAGCIIVAYACLRIFEGRLPSGLQKAAPKTANIAAVLIVLVLLSSHWMPLGPAKGMWRNILFVGGLIGGLLLLFYIFQRLYEPILRWCLAHKLLFLCIPFLLVIWGGSIWQGLGKEFMPSLDEGSYLYMPSTMSHASVEESFDMLQKLDMAIASVPEVTSVVGKIGRVDSPIDPAPISMVETVIHYKPEYAIGPDGNRVRQWREHIKTPDDIWDEIVKVAKVPGMSSAPKLQPIATRIVMLQSGMRAPMGVKVKGPDLESIEKAALEIEQFLKEVPSVEASAVIADRMVGKPYLEIHINRKAIARHGLNVRKVQDVIETAIGGRMITMTVEGRARYPVRVRYPRELRDTIESLNEILVPTAQGEGAQIPLIELAEIKYVRGPQAIKSEDTFLVGYVLFDKNPEYAEVDVVEDCQRYLKNKIASGEFELPTGVTYAFAGNYENQIRSEKRLMVVLPLALFIIFLILYFQFKSVSTTLLVCSGIFVAWAGGFQMIWLYSQDWFLNFNIFNTNMRELFQVQPFNLSVAVWVGFLALFGIATDDGVILATYLKQVFAKRKPETIEAIREATVEAGKRRIRPCLMTSATTILALIPVLTSTGRGADVMIPMAIPSFGGMTVVLVTVFVVPTLFCLLAELRLKYGRGES